MKALRPLLLLAAFALTCYSGRAAHAQQPDPGVAAAQALLKQATQPQRDASHNTMLLALRQLDDPALLALFQGLGKSPYLSMRVHGQLGSAALSPQKRIDLTALAEIDDPRELVQLLSAAIDDDLIDNDSMATLLTWDSLELPLKQAIALRLIGEGGKVDTKPFRESLDIELTDELSAARLLQYALGALVLAESGDAAGKTAMQQLAKQQGNTADAVIAQLLDAAMRQDFASAGPLALSVASDSNRQASLRLLAIQSALRLSQAGATDTWQDMFRVEESSAQRIRLAMIALDSSEQIAPAFFESLSNNGQWIDQIAASGRAIASKSDQLAKVFEPLIATGQPLSVQWVVTYCQRREPLQGPALLEQVIRHHDAGQSHHRGRITLAAIHATTALCELYPKDAGPLLQKLLATTTGDEPDALMLRQIVLMGIARARSKALEQLATNIGPDQHKDFTTDALRLFILARHGIQLTDQEWLRVSEIVQGVGQFDVGMRLQLGWIYLKHKGQAKPSITQALR